MEMNKSIRIILLIGNDRDEVLSYADAMRREGYLAVEAFDMDQGLQFFASTDLDLAILCQSMRASEQAELARRMKTERPFTPVLALASHGARPPHADICSNTGLRPATLLGRIRTLVLRTFSTKELQTHARQRMARKGSRMNREVLQSWKEIAHYMGRGLRSVQRWERNFGLPIHRKRGENRRQVFAFTDELHLWLRSKPSGSSESQEDANAIVTKVTTGETAVTFLNSWKEVANFVGFGMRTVQRWERRSGFPVHRPAGKLGSPIVALPEEIEQWLNNLPTPVRGRLALPEVKCTEHSVA